MTPGESISLRRISRSIAVTEPLVALNVVAPIDRYPSPLLVVKVVILKNLVAGGLSFTSIIPTNDSLLRIVHDASRIDCP